MDEFEFDVIGDSGPFSRLGKSIGYQIKSGGENYLLDCGAPVFQILGSEGLTNLSGIIATHAHEDHKRWFTDFALYKKFTTKSNQKIDLYGTPVVLNDFRQASAAALERTLNPTCDDIRSMEFEEFIEMHPLGPEPKFTCTKIFKDDGMFEWRVVDSTGSVVPPSKAKVIKPANAIIPRIIVRDPIEDIWVDPHTYYSIDDERFYETNGNEEFCELTDNLSLKPLNSPSWHGPPTSSYLFGYNDEKIFFSSDTLYDPELWKKLTDSKASTAAEDLNDFEDRHFIEGKIENFTDQVWSERRLQKALSIYDKNWVFIHDVTDSPANVHTPYKSLENFEGDILLTHSPDEFTTVHPMAHLGKSYVIRDNKLLEKSKDDQVHPLSADCYLKRYSEYLVGFEDPDGDYFLVKKSPGKFDVQSQNPANDEKTELIKKISLYKDIGGEYFPLIDNDNKEYLLRPDGAVEEVTYLDDGSEGKIVKSLRSQLSKDH